MLLAACGGAPAQEARAVAAQQAPWTLRPADASQLKSALDTCLGEVGASFAGGETIASGAWTPKPLPQGIDNLHRVEAFESGQSPVLIARVPGIGSRQGCSVLAAADQPTIDQAIELVGSGFAAGMKETPHGRVWESRGFLLNNDYANQHVFEPQVFASDKFFDAEYHDIRVYNCEGSCS